MPQGCVVIFISKSTWFLVYDCDDHHSDEFHGHDDHDDILSIEHSRM